jgi:hypothetical protein
MLITAICHKRRVAPFTPPPFLLAVTVAVVLYLLYTYTRCLPLTLVTHLSCPRRFYWIAGHQLDTGISIIQTKHISQDIYALGRIARR